ncbi:MAG: LysM peptidoglycan-binding domain-containing protein [Anaerolineae bacterium]
MNRRTRLVVALAALAIPLAAAPHQAHAQGYGPTTHIVRPGDTLYGIARHYGVPPMAIAKANGLMNPNFIFVGQSLIVPGAAAPMPVHRPGAMPPAGGSYVVMPGDTVFSIAARFGTTVSAIVAANGLANQNVIFVGQRLVIPGAYPPRAGPKPVYAPGPKAPCGGPYWVVPGDTLSGIAVRHGTTVGALAAANGLRYPFMIYSGQRLVIPCGTYGFRPPPAKRPPRQVKRRPPALHEAACAREVQIVRPREMETLSGVVQVIGSANIPDFQFYKVEYAPGHAPLASSFNSINNTYSKSVVDTVLTTWFVDHLAAGDYTLRLTAVDNRGQYPTPCDVHVRVH